MRSLLRNRGFHPAQSDIISPSPDSYSAMGSAPKPARHPESCMVSEVCKVCERTGDIRYNGSLDTYAYFNFRGLASGRLWRNGFSYLSNCVEITILLKCRAKHFVSRTGRFARYKQCRMSHVWIYLRHSIDRRNIFFDHQLYGSLRLF